MPKVLVIHGAGMNMRGKVQVDIFGPMTLPEYDERIRGYAKDLGVDVEIFHSNIEGEIVNRLYAATEQGFDAAIFNPAAFGTGYPALVAALSQVKFPTTEVHISNPIRRGPASQTAAVSQSVVAGFGIAGYALARRVVRDLLSAKKWPRLGGGRFALRAPCGASEYRGRVAVQDLLARGLADLRFGEGLPRPVDAELGAVGATDDAIGAVQSHGGLDRARTERVSVDVHLRL